jgi:hypothetical protein
LGRFWKSAEVARVTRWVGEKYRPIRSPIHLSWYFCNLKNKLLKVNYHPLGENSPKLVTLEVAHILGYFFHS